MSNKELERERQSALKSPGEKRAKRDDGTGGMEGVMEETDSAQSVPPGLPGASGASVGVVPPLPGSPSEVVPEGVSMQSLLQEVQKLSLNMTGQFQTLRQQLSDQACEFKSDLAKLREEMVTRSMFEELEGRIKTLETQGLANPEVSWLQQ